MQKYLIQGKVILRIKELRILSQLEAKEKKSTEFSIINGYNTYVNWIILYYCLEYLMLLNARLFSCSIFCHDDHNDDASSLNNINPPTHIAKSQKYLLFATHFFFFLSRYICLLSNSYNFSLSTLICGVGTFI